VAFSKFSIFGGRARPESFRPFEYDEPPRSGGHHSRDQPRMPRGNSDGGQWTSGSPGEGWLQAALSKGRKRVELWRLKHARRDLFGRKPDPKKSAVAFTLFEGQPIFGASSKHHKYTNDDRLRANHALEALVKRNPHILKTNDITHFPNNAIRHAEATVLLRAASKNGGTLAGKTLEVEVDRKLCPNCEIVLPLLGRHLGNPTVTFTDSTGRRFRMSGGSKILQPLKDHR
jgi:hypothetical protein